MKKTLSLFLVVIMMLTLGACGKDKKEDGAATDGKKAETAVENKFEGEWLGVGGDAWGFAMTAEDAAAYTLTVEKTEKASIVVDGDALEAKYTVDGDSIILKVEELDMESTGNLTDGAIYFEDLMGLGINIYFAKEGTDAADPSRYIPEAEKAMVGTWTSYAVTDILDEDVSDIVPADALVMNFNGDYTVDIDLAGEMIVGETWTIYEDFGYLTDSEYDFSWDVVGDEIVVSYYDGEDTYKFTCAKA